MSTELTCRAYLFKMQLIPTCITILFLITYLRKVWCSHITSSHMRIYYGDCPCISSPCFLNQRISFYGTCPLPSKAFFSVLKKRMDCYEQNFHRVKGILLQRLSFFTSYANQEGLRSGVKETDCPCLLHDTNRAILKSVAECFITTCFSTC